MELLPKKKKNKKRQRDLIDADESAVMTQSLAPPVAAHAPGRPEPMTGNGMLEAMEGKKKKKKKNKSVGQPSDAAESQPLTSSGAGASGIEADDDNANFDDLFSGLSKAKAKARERAAEEAAAAAAEAKAAAKAAAKAKREAKTLERDIFGETYDPDMKVDPMNAKVHRKDAATGLNVYKAQHLGIGLGGGTPLCPFDCDCCF